MLDLINKGDASISMKKKRLSDFSSKSFSDFRSKQLLIHENDHMYKFANGGMNSPTSNGGMNSPKGFGSPKLAQSLRSPKV